MLRFPFDTNHIEFKLSAFTFHDYKVGCSEYPQKKHSFSTSKKLFIKQVLFLTNSSASPDSQTNKAKIRDYKIAASYLRSTSHPHPDPHDPDSEPDPHDPGLDLDPNPDPDPDPRPHHDPAGSWEMFPDLHPHTPDNYPNTSTDQGRRAKSGVLGVAWKVLFCAWDQDHSHNQAR